MAIVVELYIIVYSLLSSPLSMIIEGKGEKSNNFGHTRV